MGRYIQRISLRPYSEVEMWTGWDLEGRHGHIDGLISAEGLTPKELDRYGVREFQQIPSEYLSALDFDRLK